jgi:hypothetical protein
MREAIPAVLWCRCCPLEINRLSVLVGRRENNFIGIQVVTMTRMPEAMPAAPC